MKKGTIILISFLLGLILIGGYILIDSHQPTQAETYHTVLLKTEDDKAGSVNKLSKTEYKAGEKIVLKAIPEEEYIFAGWYVADELLSANNPYIYTVNDNVTIIAKFTLEEIVETPKVYTVTLTASEGGTVIALEQTEYEENCKIVLEATANEGYNFTGFYDSTELISTENPYTYTVTKNVNIVAKFENNQTELETTSAQYFTFNGNACTGYIGDQTVPEIIIPRSYSIDDDGNFIDGNDYEVTTISYPSTLPPRDPSGFSNYQGNIICLENISVVTSSAFYSCRYVKNIILSENTKLDGSAIFYTCFQITKFVIPNVEIIPAGLFYSCTSLNEVVIPNSVKEISSTAFHNCSSLEEIILPNSIEFIGSNAFYMCKNLTSVTILSEVPPVLVSVSAISTATETIYIPFGTLTAYQTADVWCDLNVTFEELPADYVVEELVA